MPRPEKVQAVADIKERFEASEAVFLTEYAGLSVGQQQALRRGLRASEAEYKVVKMTLARLAVNELGLDDLDPLLYGPTALAFAAGDPVTVAKTLSEFAKENESLVIKGGLMGREFLTTEKVSELAKIESREVLLAKLAGAMKAPMTEMAGLAAAFLRGSATMFQQLLEKKEEDAPPVTAAEETAAVETPDADPVEAPEAVETQEPAAEAEEIPVAEETADADEDEAPEADETAEAAAEATAEPAAEESTTEEEAEADETEAKEDDPAEAEEEN